MQTGREYLLDTNIVIDFFRGDQKIVELVSSIRFAIPSIVLGELLYGANLTQQRERRLKQVSEFIEELRVVNVDQQTAEYYAEIKANLKRQGTPIPENDIWIAALSERHSLILATRDSHFEKVLSTEVEFW